MSAPSRRFLLVALGSTADVAPFLALGAALRAAGHAATLLADPSLSSLAASAGLDFAPLASPTLLPEPLLHIPPEPKLVAALYASLVPIFHPLLDAVLAQLPNHDALVTSRLFPFLRNAASAASRQCAVLALDPLGLPFPQTTPAGSVPPAWLPRFLHAAHHRSAWRAQEWQLDQMVNRFAGPALRARNLGNFHGFLSQPADRILVAISPILFPPPGPPPPSYVYTGFLHGPSPPDAAATTRLAPIATLARGGAPVPVLSLPRLFSKAEAPILHRLLAAWPNDLPLVIHSANTPPNPDLQRPEILLPGPVPVEELFTHATVVIHDGGYATTVAALYAGRAQIVIPPSRNPPYWAAALARLGVARILDPATWPEQLPAAVDAALRDVATVRRVTECASTLRAENGPALAVAELEKFWPA